MFRMSTYHERKFSPEEEMSDGLQKGKEAAYIQIFETYHNLMYMKALYMLKDEEEAEDVVQDIFIKLWQKREDINIQLSLKSYLLTAVRNRCLDLLRLREKLAEEALHYKYIKEETIEYRPFENDELSRQLGYAIESITAKATRKIFKLVYLEGKNHREVAEMLNLSVGTVKLQVSNALRLLRDKLETVK